MRIGFVTTAVTAACLGTNEFAIYNAGMNLLSLGFHSVMACKSRQLHFLDKHNDRQEAISYGQICQGIGLMMSLMLSVFLLIFGSSIMSLYFKDPIIIQQAITVTRFIMIIVLLKISQLIYGGCLRAGGDVRFKLLATIISVTVIRSLVTLISVHHSNLALHGIWIGILADQISRFTLLRNRFKKVYWTKIKI